MDYRVEELAAEAGISVELLRSYQSRGLLPPPRHEGRLAVYGRGHLRRLERIRELKQRGWSLRMIERELADRVAPDTVQQGLDPAEEVLSLSEVAERSGVPPAVLRSFEASGIIRPRRFGTEKRYTEADVRAVRMLLSLLGGGLPMEELMKVARVQLDAAGTVAEGAVDLFMTYIRGPLRRSGLSQREEAERLVASLRLMLHSATALMTYSFQRMVLNAAQEALERDGSRSERAALHREVARRRLELTIPA